MKRKPLYFCLVIVFLFQLSITHAKKLALKTPSRNREVAILKQKSIEAQRNAWEVAEREGWKTKGYTQEGAFFELMRIEEGRPIYYVTYNGDAAISSATDKIRNVSPYNVNGNGYIVGVWDAGHVLNTHVEFGDRVTLIDPGSVHWHATHVAGTIAASGVDENAMGMAPSVDIESYWWGNDTVDMDERGATNPAQPGDIYISNHSYGDFSGWESVDVATPGTYNPHWYGTWGNQESDYFGLYNNKAADWDNLCSSKSYFLPFKAAGNNNDDSAPAQDKKFYYTSGGSWQSKTYDPATDPGHDFQNGGNFQNGGYDTISTYGCAKNVMTVGAVHDAVSFGERSLTDATMLRRSGWGPTDDGRIKPDIVANGYNLWSTRDGHINDYGWSTGTSMACPTASGSAVLLQEYYERLFPGQSMLSSTLKALIIHTADDLGNPGPDYSFGWGLMNTQAAADHITEHNDITDQHNIIEGLLNVSNPSDTYEVIWDGSSPIRATLCWTDPPGDAQSGLNNPTLVLENDLDLRVIALGGSPIYLPYVLDPDNPASNATTGDNTRDNVEQVFIQSPSTSGEYTIQVGHKYSLIDDEQQYSLIISGQTTCIKMMTLLYYIDLWKRGDIGMVKLMDCIARWKSGEGCE